MSLFECALTLRTKKFISYFKIRFDQLSLKLKYDGYKIIISGFYSLYLNKVRPRSWMNNSIV